jgi:hypothetical protein
LIVWVVVDRPFVFNRVFSGVSTVVELKLLCIDCRSIVKLRGWEIVGFDVLPGDRDA